MPLLRHVLQFHFWSLCSDSVGCLQLLLLPAKVVLAAYHIPSQMERCLMAFGTSRPDGNFLSKGGSSSGKRWELPHTHTHTSRAAVSMQPPLFRNLNTHPCQFTSAAQQHLPLSLPLALPLVLHFPIACSAALGCQILGPWSFPDLPGVTDYRSRELGGTL